MNAEKLNRSSGGEVVGVFSDLASLESAIAALIDGGVAQSALSLLTSHDSLAVAGKPTTAWRDAAMALVGEIKYEGPLVASGLILLAGGATAGLIAGVIGAAVGGVALKEILDEATASPHTDDFARAVAAGSIILWVGLDAADEADLIIAKLEGFGATNVHIHQPID